MQWIVMQSPVLWGAALLIGIFAFLAGRGKLSFSVNCLGLAAVVAEIFACFYMGAELEEVVMLLLIWNGAFLAGEKLAKGEAA